ncbi:hypothetical protein SEHO0A_04247 [Salmonella enterica subsp. houtenae str. ATCC BAA-1581]|nr:hypothetical protein SEHO0A_04247 [Salmonella enterica subsp. houtenae str. ATCC BAA-1581]
MSRVTPDEGRAKRGRSLSPWTAHPADQDTIKKRQIDYNPLFLVFRERS